MARKSSRPAAPPPIPAIDAGLKLLGMRAHSRLELRRKLVRRGYAEDEVDGALTRLTALGYLNDSKFAEGHVRRRSVARGPLALSAELAARGVDRRAADAALGGFDRPAQVAAATSLAQRLAGHRPPAGYRELLNSVGAKLLRRGFSIAVAQEACMAVWADRPNP